jgi:hypothetical protein
MALGDGSRSDDGPTESGVLPTADRLVEMRWRDALFAHWPADPDAVATHVPDELDVATYDGRAWLGVVGFVMEDIRPRGFPVGLSFPEVNLRTYVRRPGDATHSVYFFNLDADDRLGVSVARRFFALPYYRAEMRVRSEGDAVTLVSHRVHRGAPRADVDVTYRPVGEAFVPDPGSFEHFLTENYRFYAAGASLYAGEISHPPWSLREASVSFRTNSLFEANGFDAPEGAPVAHYSPGSDVTAGRIRAVDD